MNIKQSIQKNITSKVEVNEVSAKTVNQVTTSKVTPKEGEFLEASQNKEPTYQDGLIAGVSIGIKVGVTAGYQHAINEVAKIIPDLVKKEIANQPDITGAISDGLRSGSSKCGEVMANRFKTLN